MNERLMWHKEEVEDVIKALLNCETQEEIEEIFDRILTPREINDIGRRYKALGLLEKGGSYSEVKQETGMSPTTIARISAKLGYGFRKNVEEDKDKQSKQWSPKRKKIYYKGIGMKI